MKQFIVDTKTYSLDDTNQLINKVSDDKTVYNSIIRPQQLSFSKNSKYITAVLVSSLISASSVAITNETNDANLNQLKNILSIDNEHNQYIDFLKSQTNSDVQKRQMITEQILSFKSLSNNWDGYDAIPTEIKSASNAIVLIQKLKPLVINKITSVHPTTNGTVSFIWENNNDERVSFEIGNNNYSFYTKLNNLKPSFFEGSIAESNWVLKLETEVKRL